jgi:DNA-binding GntR family transcriptional regulator
VTKASVVPRTNEEIAYQRLRELILARELPVDEFLPQRKLAEIAGAAVVTVRTALRTLENEGLIENIPRWGVRIPRETEETLRDRYYMREVLELAAVRRILDRGSPSCTQVLREKAEKCDGLEAEDPENIKRFAELHYDFHHYIAECSESPLLMECLDRVSLKTMMLSNSKRGWGRGQDRTTHLQLVDNIFSGNANQSEEALRKHIRRGLDLELEVIGLG